VASSEYCSSSVTYLQWSNQTRPNRFPKIFARIKELNPEPRRILSFGCSTGEECFSLAELFPTSEIVGVDVNSWSLKQAKENNKFGDQISFHFGLDDDLGTFDVVTSLMVLFSMWQPLTLSHWRDTMREVSSHVAEKGIWTIYTSQYSFRKSSVDDQYDCIKRWRRIHPKDNKRYFSGYYKKKEAAWRTYYI
jgi:trans-aconitate methyltransferase